VSGLAITREPSVGRTPLLGGTPVCLSFPCIVQRAHVQGHDALVSAPLGGPPALLPGHGEGPVESKAARASCSGRSPYCKARELAKVATERSELSLTRLDYPTAAGHFRSAGERRDNAALRQAIAVWRRSAANACPWTGPGPRTTWAPRWG